MRSPCKLVRISGALLDEGETFLRRHAQFEQDGMPGYGDCLFTTAPVDECEALVIFNSPPESLSVKVADHHIFAFMQEPGDPFMHPWMYKGLDNYSKVYSPRPVAPNVTASHGFIGWSVNLSLRELITMPPPGKKRHMSCIISNANIYPGHRRRLALIQQLIDAGLEFDLRGRGFRPVSDKWTSLAPYRYSIALENEAIPHYFTEKITDCFLAWTIPLYWGCTNLETYFPSEAFIRINAEDPAEAVRIIRSLDEREYKHRFPALTEARRLAIEKYQPLAKINNILSGCSSRSKIQCRIDPVLPNPLLKRAFGVWKKQTNVITDRFCRRYNLKRLSRYAKYNFV